MIKILLIVSLSSSAMINSASGHVGSKHIKIPRNPEGRNEFHILGSGNFEHFCGELHQDKDSVILAIANAAD